MAETLMYSIHSVTGDVVEHRLPFSGKSKALGKYVDKGFTFEHPMAEEPREPSENEYFCDKCDTIHRNTSKLGKRHLKTLGE